MQDEKNSKTELRCCPRMPINVSVMLCQHGVPAAPAKTRNITLNGMFLELKHAFFPENSLLEVEFEDRDGNTTHYYRIQAHVVYHTEEGIGIEFDDSIPEVRQVIKPMLEKIGAWETLQSGH